MTDSDGSLDNALPPESDERGRPTFLIVPPKKTLYGPLALGRGSGASTFSVRTSELTSIEGCPTTSLRHESDTLQVCTKFCRELIVRVKPDVPLKSPAVVLPVKIGVCELRNSVGTEGFPFTRTVTKDPARQPDASAVQAIGTSMPVALV